jgi:hypothetical protein
VTDGIGFLRPQFGHNSRSAIYSFYETIPALVCRFDKPERLLLVD